MNTILEHLTGMHTLTDQVIATDFLIGAKNAVRSYAMAVTECPTPEIRDMLARQLDEAVATHEKIANYMVERGWYLPHDTDGQLALDLNNMETALNIPG
ncbi:spore coat protein [Paenibacillus doosanensis]|uniref:spore coat protein n=1 Tax=Paenibacillus doosanensis TaxID=1229154 RepID=UPI00217FFC99|nr:spore coat protein [Paenibacillus doosanensis]MCS7464126.1 spore coat protein [Paenibacillus doosanensis]